MDSVKAKLAAFQSSKPGQFLQKFNDDQATNLASILAWGTLSTMLPLLLGMLGLAGLILRDPQTLDKVYSTILSAIPQQASGTLGTALQAVRHQAAAPAGVVGLVLLLFNGSKFFANMQNVFNLAFHVPNRNVVLHYAVAVLMLIISTALLIVSVVALGLGGLIGQLPFALPFGPAAATAITWSLSILSAILLFFALYIVLPNTHQGWRDALPGALLSTVLFFLITLIFPLYVKLFPPNQAYAAFGVFLVLTFWLYLLGLVFVLGAELNAFIQQPARSVAMAEAQERAQRGQAAVQAQSGMVKAEATGDAPDSGGTREPSGSGSKGSLFGQKTSQKGAASNAAQTGASSSAVATRSQGNAAARPTLAGKVLGFAGLVVAAALLRGRTVPEEPRAQSHA